MGLYLKILPNNKVEIRMGMLSTTVNRYELQNVLNRLNDDEEHYFENLGRHNKDCEYVTAKDILNMPKKYIGGTVINYECEVPEAVEKWKIFYADDTNIFLIADDYIHGVFFPEGKKGTKMPVVGYRSELNCIMSDYESFNHVDERLCKHFEYMKYHDKKASWQALEKLAYLVDTDAWSIFKGEKAEYAIAGPTIDLLAKSYSLVYPETPIEYSVSELGYKIKHKKDYFSTTAVSDLKPYHFLYYKIEEQKAEAMFVIGIFETYASLMCIDYTGCLEGCSFSNRSRFSFRPVVCLKSDVKLNEVSEGIYETIK